MRITFSIIFAALIAAVPSSLSAQPIRSDDGNDLYTLCQTGSAYRNEGCPAFIMGWIRGFQNGHAIAASVAERSGSKVDDLLCFPDTVKSDQMRDIVVSYLQRYPQKRHRDAGFLILDAMYEAFRCK